MEVSCQLHAPGHFIPGAHLIGDLVGPRAGLDAVAEKIRHCPFRELNPGRRARGSVTVLNQLTSQISGRVEEVDSM
jgi:hypothetical protein